MNDTLIIGIATVDAIARTVTSMPPPGGLSFFEHLTLTTGGCAVNCSIALAKLGVACDVIVPIGADLMGDFVVSELARHGIASNGIVRDAGASTAFTFVTVGPGGERAFLHTPGANSRLSRAAIPLHMVQGRRHVFVTGAMLMDALDGEPTAALLRDARAAGATTLLDTVFVDGLRRDEWQRRIGPCLPHLDFFLPSLPEARAMTGFDDPLRIAQELQSCGARHVVIKLADAGALCRDAAGHEFVVPAFRVEDVVDTTGAGDCWCAGFLVGLRESLPIAEAARLGNAVAAHGIRAAGAVAGVVPLAQVRAFMRRASPREVGSRKMPP